MLRYLEKRYLDDGSDNFQFDGEDKSLREELENEIDFSLTFTITIRNMKIKNQIIILDFVYIYFSAFDTSFGKLLNYLFLKTYQKILQD